MNLCRSFLNLVQMLEGPCPPYRCITLIIATKFEKKDDEEYLLHGNTTIREVTRPGDTQPLPAPVTVASPLTLYNFVDISL